ncbi:hypothetical protein MSP7336_01842 [Mycobacterium shimoidei]|uniref:Uncharacterized protein n=1 Tax=Mycobacterium shimoidei TaxID=29313 RepID=A0A375YXG4_MYCSH|nr:hypothetical protein [Mycobacterium shimoidei]SRX93603.1 hypothetical protein MSP7336_01842 [Mycobacterium shimoidei]
MNQLHFAADLRRFDPEDVLGPDNFDAYYVIDSVDYDAATGRSTATLRPLPPADLADRRRAALSAMTKRARIAQLFNPMPGVDR